MRGSLRHLPRRSSKNYDLQFANSNIFKENDESHRRINVHACAVRSWNYLFNSKDKHNSSSFFIGTTSLEAIDVVVHIDPHTLIGIIRAH